MTPEELVLHLAKMADRWEQVAEERQNAVVRIVFAALLREPDLSRADLRRLLDEALDEGLYPDVNIDDRLAVMTGVFPYAGLSASERKLLTDTLSRRLDETVSRMEVALLATILNGGDEAAQLQTLRTATEKGVASYTGHVSSLLTVLDRVALSGGAEDVYEYVGPADAKNRPFCGHIVRLKSIYTRKGVESLNNHPLLNAGVAPNVFIFCGGHKCRHIWLPVSAANLAALEAQGWTVEDGEGA